MKKQIKDMAVYGMPKEQFKGESPYPQSYITEYKDWQRAENKKMAKYIDDLKKETDRIIGRQIVYVKSYGICEIYERRNGVRGLRVKSKINKNYDMIPYLKNENGDIFDVKNILLVYPEMYNFLMGSSHKL